MRLQVIPWNDGSVPAEDSLRRRLEDDGFDVFHWRDESGAYYQAHSHQHDESLWVLEGEMKFEVGGQQLHLHPGDRLMLPKGTIHTALAGPGGVTYLIGERHLAGPS